MISVSFFATVAETPTVKQTKTGGNFTIVKLRTEKKVKDVLQESVWEVTLFGKMGANVAECNVGDGLTCIGTMEMRDFEYNGKKYSKPQITLTHAGVSVGADKVNRDSAQPVYAGTKRTVTSFDPKPTPPFTSGPSPSSPSRSNGFSDEDFNDIPF